MTKTFNVSFPKELTQELDRAARREKRSRSELLREAARLYLARQQRWQALFRYGAERAATLNITEKDIDRLVHEVRQERH